MVVIAVVGVGVVKEVQAAVVVVSSSYSRTLIVGAKVIVR